MALCQTGCTGMRRDAKDESVLVSPACRCGMLGRALPWWWQGLRCSLGITAPCTYRAFARRVNAWLCTEAGNAGVLSPALLMGNSSCKDIFFREELTFKTEDH